MSDVKRCGIYSFPKSGNTWMRELIRALFEIEESTSTAIPDIYENGIDGKVVLSNSGQQWKFYKSHSKGEVVTYQNNSVVNDLIIYIVRNPYDVFCSQLNYVLRGFEKNKGRMILTCKSVDEAADLGLIEEYFSAFTVYGTLDPYFWDAGNWKENVSNWLDKASKDERVVIIRYEDMVEDIVKALAPVTQRLGLSSDKINSAFQIADTRTNDGGKFFWKKSSGTYKSYLLEKNINNFKKYHSDILKPLGYDEL